jgi:hypothetical protein
VTGESGSGLGIFNFREFEGVEVTGESGGGLGNLNFRV